MHFPQKSTYYVAALALLAACQAPRPAAPPVVVASAPIVQLGQQAFSTDEFFQAFTRHQLSADSGRSTTLRDYLTLYTNQKLKVLAAEQAGQDTTEAFREEMATYRQQLAQSYLTDKPLVEQLAQEAYTRMQEEVNVSHILFLAPDDAPPADTTAARQRALSARDQLRSGADFAPLARQLSQDASAQQNGGNLGFLTAFQAVYPFETAMYNTPVGSLAGPIRTRAGYHLIRVNARRPARGTVQVAHVLARISPGANPMGQQQARQRIDQAAAALRAGATFEDVARQFSDDATTRNAGGVLPAFTTGQMIPAFEEAAFALKNTGDVSAPVQTNYGWHILKLIDRKGLAPYDEMAPALRQKVVTDTRADVLRATQTQRLSRDYAVQTNGATLQTVLTLADSTLTRGAWKPNVAPALATQPLLTVAGRTATAGEFVEFARRRQQPRPAGTVPALTLQRLYERYVADRLVAAEEANLETKYPEFKALMTQLREDVLLAQQMEEQVWERSLADSVGQKRYYDAHREQYRYPDRVAAVVVSATSDSLLRVVNERLTRRPFDLRRAGPSLDYQRGQTQPDTPQRERLTEVLATLVRNPDYVVDVAASRETGEPDSVSAARLAHAVRFLTAGGVSLGRIIEKNTENYRPGADGRPLAGPALRSVTFRYYTNNRQDVARALNAGRPGAVTIAEGLFSRGQNATVDVVPWQPGQTTTRAGGRVTQVNISRVEPARLRTFAEARGAVINDYQRELETQWLSNLRSRFPVRISEDELRKLNR